MKKINITFIFAIVAILGLAACEPIEDQSLREKYVTNVGSPITKADLTAALSVTQPYPNEDTKVEGDQIVVLENKRPDLGGCWHIGTSTGETILKSESVTYTYESNGSFEIYYVAMSANKPVESEHFAINVTNVFDPWAGFITGAKDKADQDAKKTWGFREVSWGSVCNMGAHGGWKYTSAGYTPESNFCWWANITLADAGDQTMVFEYSGNKMTTYNAAGDKVSEGTFGFDKTVPEDLVLGSLITSAKTIGAAYDETGQVDGEGAANSFYLLTFTSQYITLYHNGWGGSSDWGDCGWYVYFQAK